MSRQTLTQSLCLANYRDIQNTRTAGQSDAQRWAADNRRLTRQIQREQKREPWVLDVLIVAACCALTGALVMVWFTPGGQLLLEMIRSAS